MSHFFDLHSHLLPGVDDGAATLDDALAMARTAYEHGVRRIVVTPHAFKGTLDVTPDKRDIVLSELQGILAEDGIDIQLLPGFECHLVHEFVEVMRAEPRYLMGEEGTNVFLVEIPDDLVPPGFESFLFNANMQGFKPLVAHIERNTVLMKKKDEELQLLRDGGTRLQITTSCLVGRFGWKVKRAAVRLLKRDLVDVVSTDAHSLEDYALLPKALKVLEKTVGTEKMHTLIWDNPKRLVTKHG
jgi:protein-tyrosine phosphatase